MPATFTSRNVLVVLNERERSLFFPGDLETRLAAFADQSRWLEPPDSAGAWREILRQERPDALVGAWSLPALDDEALAECPELSCICYTAGALRGLVSRTFWERGGVASNWGGVISRTIAECALTLTLACLRRVPQYYRQMKLERVQWRQRWMDPEDLEVPRSLFGRRVGIHGFGHVARELLKLLRPFGVMVEAYSAPVPPGVFEAHGVAQAASLRELFARNEILIEVEALTPQSEKSVGEDCIAALRHGAVFVNVGRGAVVDEEALIRRAAKGDIFLGLDVYAHEPLPLDSPLRFLPNALIFPHTAGPTLDHYPLCGAAVLKNLEAWQNQEPLPQAFTLEHYDRTT